MNRVFLILMLVVVLLTGCGGNNGMIPPVDEDPQNHLLDKPDYWLIKQYIYTVNVVRWGNGTVLVRDETGRTEEIWQEINQIIKGSVVFKISSQEEDWQIEIKPGELFCDYCYTIDGLFNHNRFLRDNSCEYDKCNIYLNPSVYEELSQDVYLTAVLMACGINEAMAKEGLTDDMKKVLFWLYDLEPCTMLF